MDLCLQLQTVRKNDSNVDDYIWRIKSIADRLATIGDLIPDSD